MEEFRHSWIQDFQQQYREFLLPLLAQCPTALASPWPLVEATCSSRLILLQLRPEVGVSFPEKNLRGDSSWFVECQMILIG